MADGKGRSNLVGSALTAIVVFGAGIAVGFWLAAGGGDRFDSLMENLESVAGYELLPSSEDPFQCSILSSNSVHCQVLIDRVVITDIVLNRGNCRIAVDLEVPPGGVELRFGDRHVIVHNCANRLVELEISTRSSGTWTYSWR